MLFTPSGTRRSVSKPQNRLFAKNVGFDAYDGFIRSGRSRYDDIFTGGSLIPGIGELGG